MGQYRFPQTVPPIYVAGDLEKLAHLNPILVLKTNHDDDKAKIVKKFRRGLGRSFLAVQNSSIGDLVTDSLTYHSLSQ